jgi:hypothetical protein
VESDIDDGTLEAIRLRRARSTEEARQPIRHLFLFGADPNSDWLSGSGVALAMRSGSY